MIDTYALLLNQVMACLGGFLIGIGLKTIIDGFAARDVVDGRLDAIDRQLEDLEDDVDEINEELVATMSRVDRLEPASDKPSEADVNAAVEMLRPPFGDYHKTIRPLEHPIAP